MTLFMDMALGLKTPPPNMKIFQNWKSENPPPKHENIPKLELSLRLGHKNDIIHGYGVRVENPPPNMKIFQNWNSH